MNETEDEPQIMRDLAEKYSSLIGNFVTFHGKAVSFNESSIVNEGEGVVVSKNLAPFYPPPPPKAQTEPEQDSHRSYWCAWCSYP